MRFVLFSFLQTTIVQFFGVGEVFVRSPRHTGRVSAEMRLFAEQFSLALGTHRSMMIMSQICVARAMFRSPGVETYVSFAAIKFKEIKLQKLNTAGNNDRARKNLLCTA